MSFQGMTPASDTRGRWLLLLATLFWSTSGYFTKVIHIHPVAMAGYRALFATIVLLPFIPRTRRTFHPAMIWMVLCFALMNVCFVSSMVFTSAANSIFLEYTAPFWMFLIGRVWLKEKLQRRNVIALTGGMTGIAILLFGNWSLDPLGLTLGLIAGFTFAGVSLFLRYLRDHDALWLTFLNLATSAVLVLPFVAVVHPEWLAGSPSDFFNVALFGVVQTGVAYLLYSQGLARVTAQEAGLITLFEPVINPIWAWIAIREIPHDSTLIGGAFILVSVSLRYLAPALGWVRKRSGRRRN